ncbi:carbohydrate sulfotransferase 14-like [Mercenaria mercenaria]|uniref:carbohydrate sulfotransferase 14-like n=1 Tax=Mercenaria mercenaria TaxID=6596 RepID=UPI00234E53E4|nr:carbohydrate sulfotransferase 14-like [Mercenaria mercenaria]
MDSQDVVAQNDLQSLYNNRNEHIKAVCQKNLTLEPYENLYQNRTHLVLDRYNLSFCKVPKCGSTLWVQIVSILRDGISNLETLLNMNRLTLHRKTTHLKSLKKLRKYQLKYFIISRNPYSRLYSAFVDKSFLLFAKAANSGKYSRSQKMNCSLANQIYNESFQQFLDRIFVEIRTGDSNHHWMPIFSLCNPCYTDIILHVKLEEFSRDMKYIYSRLGFSEEVQTHLKNLTTSKLASLTGIASTVFYKGLQWKKCRDNGTIAERLWISFQTQGYISEKSKFPRHLFDLYCKNNTVSSTEIFMKLVSTEMTLKSLSKGDADAQRRGAIVQAYRTLHPDTIATIQQLFRMDFLMFNYSTTPPS